MPIEVVSVRVREHQHRERTPSGVVFWAAAGRDAAGIVRRNERMKEFEGGRRPTTGRSGTKGEMSRRISLESEQMLETERSVRSVGKERVIFLFHSTILQPDCQCVEECVNFERRSKNDPSNVEQRYLEVVVSRVSWRATERILPDLDRAATCHQDSLLTVIL